MDPALSMLRVEARVGAGALVAGNDAALEALRGITGCDDAPPPRRDGRRILPGTRSGGIGGCVRYAVSLADMPRGWWAENLDQAGDNCTVAIDSWLWRPESGAGPVSVKFDLPEGFGVSVPWQPLGDQTYLIPPSPGSGTPIAVFGRFERLAVAVPGGTLDVAVLRGRSGPDTAKVRAWLASAAGNVALAYGRFPNPDAQVIVNTQLEPAGYGAGSAVPFGHVIRDGGESVQFYINDEQPLDRFLADWTATHEFAHLLLPYLGSEYSWISEGFADYYQNVLMARGGRYDARRAWQKLYEGFMRAAAEPRRSPNAASAAGIRKARMMVYWSGAALALLGDVELRHVSGGAESLDTALERLQRCCLPAERRWHGRELFARLDALTGHAVFAPLYDRYADRPGMPPFAAVFAELGVIVAEGRVSLADAAPRRAIRDAIMRAPTLRAAVQR